MPLTRQWLLERMAQWVEVNSEVVARTSLLKSTERLADG